MPGVDLGVPRNTGNRREEAPVFFNQERSGRHPQSHQMATMARVSRPLPSAWSTSFGSS